MRHLRAYPGNGTRKEIIGLPARLLERVGALPRGPVFESLDLLSSGVLPKLREV